MHIKSTACPKFHNVHCTSSLPGCKRPIIGGSAGTLPLAKQQGEHNKGVSWLREEDHMMPAKNNKSLKVKLLSARQPFRLGLLLSLLQTQSRTAGQKIQIKLNIISNVNI